MTVSMTPTSPVKSRKKGIKKMESPKKSPNFSSLAGRGAHGARGIAEDTKCAPNAADEYRTASCTMVELAQALASMSNSSAEIEEPNNLVDLEPENIDGFIHELKRYKERGGNKGMFEFIDAGLLQLIRELEMEDPSADENAVYAFLFNETKPKTVRNIHQILCSEVRIDSSKKTGKSKLQSLFLPLNATVKKLNLNDHATNDHDFVFSYEQQKELLLSKLPKPFLQEFQVWEKYKPKAMNTKQLYFHLKAVEADYNGTWGHATSNGKTMTEIDIEEAYRQEVEEARSVSSRLRSKHKKQRNYNIE